MEIISKVEKFSRWINVILIICSFLAYLSPYVDPGKFWILSFFGLAYPWLLLGNMIFVIYWLVKKKAYFLFSLGCILLGWNHLTSFIGLNVTTASTASASLTVMSYNMRNLQSLHIKDAKLRDKKETEFLRFVIQGGQPDILCAQECNKNVAPFIRTSLDLPYYHRAGYFGPIIFTRYPIIDRGEISFENSSNASVWVDVKFKEETIRIYSVHLQSTKVSPLAEKVITQGDIQEKETWLDIKGMLGGVKRATQQRAHQVRLLARHIATSPHPVILGGDFNDNPQSFSYHLLTQELEDAFRQSGRGLGTTYAGKIPALRIDYILVDPHFQSSNYRTLRGNYSDHYPVVTEIAWRKK